MTGRYLSLNPFILWPRAERPLDWGQRFGRAAPLMVEIGFGNGEFLVRQAQSHPEHNLVGIEVAWASVQRALRRLAQAQVENVRLLQVDARVALERLFPPQSLQHVYALFPCPWPKSRHAKHRLFSHAFLTLLNSRLLPFGTVHIVTDQYPYLEWILAQLPGTGFTLHWRPVPPRHGTKYERKWHAEGQGHFYELSLRKQEPRQVPLKEDVPLQTHRLSHFDPDAFQPATSRHDLIVEFKDFLYDARQQKGMVWVLVVEEGFQQDFWIEIVRGPQYWHIRPARGCAVVPTAGVQRALDLVRAAAQPSSASP